MYSKKIFAISHKGTLHNKKIGKMQKTKSVIEI